MITSPGRGIVGVVTGCVALLTGCGHANPADPIHAKQSGSMAGDTQEMQRSAFVTGCAGTSAGWQATAVVSNRDVVEHTYLVVISFMTPESADNERDLERTRTEVLVAPGATQDFTTETRLDPVTRPQTVRCVLRGVEQL
ncbi:hypothetical protein [Nocardia sp. CDC160]|uniref:hypothetical protein n=1 Tax=Nocardia sp. CDC160 TaxID=3112166 RepID=UPI002DB857F1|nr:hypothetical protein [Nocardia sp. CDC160]MEC3916381.1 hypothetical protein [Nocardia sp. CDC160]